FTRIFQWIGRAIGLVVSAVFRPFRWAGGWYAGRGFVLKGILGALVIVVVCLYGYFFYVTQWWNNFDPDYPAALSAQKDPTAAGSPLDGSAADSQQNPTSCKPSA